MEGEKKQFWFAARTRHGKEIRVKRKLESLGVENFIPTTKGRNTRGSLVEKPLINSLVFLRSDKADALELTNTGGLPVKYMIDCATRTLLIVPDKQMDDFRRVLDEGISEGGLVDAPLEIGDRVRVVKGSMIGVEGNVLELQGKSYIVASLCDCLYAKAQIPRAWLERV